MVHRTSGKNIQIFVKSKNNARIIKMKVVVLSPYRSATQSTTTLLRKLGYKTVHFGGSIIRSKINIIPELKKVSHKYEAFSDSPFSIMYEYFDITYPGSKFILIKRDPESWYNSILKLNEKIKQKVINPSERAFFKQYLGHVPILYKDIPYEDYILCYNRHIQAVEEYFKDRDNLLVLDINDNEKGLKICNFLNKDPIDFPHVDFIK